MADSLHRAGRSAPSAMFSTREWGDEELSRFGDGARAADGFDETALLGRALTEESLVRQLRAQRGARSLVRSLPTRNGKGVGALLAMPRFHGRGWPELARARPLVAPNPTPRSAVDGRHPRALWCRHGL